MKPSELESQGGILVDMPAEDIAAAVETIKRLGHAPINYGIKDWHMTAGTETELKEAAEEYERLAGVHGEGEFGSLCKAAASNLRVSLVNLQWLPLIKNRPVET